MARKDLRKVDGSKVSQAYEAPINTEIKTEVCTQPKNDKTVYQGWPIEILVGLGLIVVLYNL